MGKKHKIPHCENISKVQQKNCRNKMENKYYPIIVTVPKSNNTMWYNGILGQRIDVGILDVVTVISAGGCAIRCNQHINCNNFNFGRINMKCELVGARKTDSKTNIN
jgi:hypothetical protein